MGPVNIFISCAHEDEKSLQELKKHLSILQRSKLITIWSKPSPLLATDWKDVEQGISKYLESADIILPLISNSFLKSDYYLRLMERALERYDSEKVSVIPILLTSVDLEETPLKGLPVLPTRGKAVTEWQDRDEVFVNIVEGVRKAVTTFRISSLAREEPSTTREKLSTNIQDEQMKSIAFKEPIEKWESDDELREIAKLLQRRKQLHHHTVLVLGARAGGLFRSNYFYEILQLFSDHTNKDLSRIEQFGECYPILKKYFSQMDAHSIIQTSLQDVATTKGDECLAQLLKQGYFDEIITTNIDDMLEQSLLQLKIKKYSDYEVLIPAMTKDDQIQVERSHPFRIIKLFGDFASRTYSIERDGPTSITNNQIVKSFLQPILARDILVIGLDPIWDKELLHAISAGSGAMWFVGEEISSEYSMITSFPQDRHVVYVEGRDGSYESFMTKLYNMLSENVSSNSQPHDDLLINVLQQLRAMEKSLQVVKDIVAKLESSKTDYSPNIQNEQ
jgi:hypothetical protein